MVTALDFPDELLYTESAIWLRDDGAGSARIGLNAFAAAPGEADVYLVKLPRAGARIERGQPFGHVDFGRCTVPLVAPVTGKVLFPNTDLRGEPGLLARDPFGRGYLLELEGIEGEELDLLLDRDEAAARFAVPLVLAGLTGEQVYRPGRPWATSTSVRAGALLVAQSHLLPPEGNEVFTPDWVTGDTWVVETQAHGAVRRFRFEVAGRGQVAGEEVTRVRAVAVTGADEPAPPFSRVLHYRVADHSLAALDEVSTKDPLSARRRLNPRGREAWLEIAEAQDGFIADHPLFPATLDDEARDIGAGARESVPAISHYVKFRGGLTRLEAEMRADVRPEGGAGHGRLLTAFVFERGAPWWSEASRILDGKELARAKLLEA